MEQHTKTCQNNQKNYGFIKRRRLNNKITHQLRKDGLNDDT